MLDTVEGPTSVHANDTHRLAAKLGELRGAAYNAAREYLAECGRTAADLTQEAEVGATLFLLRRVTRDMESALLGPPTPSSTFDDDLEPF